MPTSPPTPATSSQLKLSQEVADQITQRGLRAVGDAIRAVLDRDADWITAARNALIEVTYPHELPVDPIASSQRSAFDASISGRFGDAERVLRDLLNAGGHDRFLEGWLLEQVAEVVHHLDAVRSQDIMSAAHERNGSLLKPIRGVVYRRVDTLGMDQARQTSAYLRATYPNANALVLGIKGILDRLVFVPDTSEAFEQAMMELGLNLGFGAQRPEKETGVGGLDVLWGIGERQYLLLPCKNGATADVISKDYTDEISGSVNWFASNYDHTCSATPVIIHPSMTLDPAAAPPPNMRVMTATRLDALRAASQAFALAVKDRLNEVDHIGNNLRIQKLLGLQIVSEYTAVPKRTVKTKRAAAAD